MHIVRFHTSRFISNANIQYQSFTVYGESVEVGVECSIIIYAIGKYWY